MQNLVLCSKTEFREEGKMQKKIATVALFAILSLSMSTALTTTVRAATEEEIENAITLGVAYLAGHQNPDGSWGVSKIATTGLVLMKLQMRAYELDYESPFDPNYPYSSNVTAGWSFIFSTDGASNPLYALKQPLSLQDHTAGASGTVDDPDTNGNDYGIFLQNPDVYNTGIVLMALEASGTPDRANDGGIDYDGDGFADTFKQIAQDMADWLSWSQGDLGNDEGGYGYGALDNAGGWTDNSNTGYAYLGLAAAEGFGCNVPEWVKTELNVWITTIQDPVDGDTDDGGSYYNPDWGPTMENELKAGNLIFQMTFYGDDPTALRFMDAMDYIERHWQDMNNDPGWGYGMSPSNYQSMFCLMKGFNYSQIDLIDLDGDGTPEHDWYDEFSTVLVNQQNLADGAWYMTWYVNDPAIQTAWALLTLERIAPPPPVIPVNVDIKPGSWPNPINIVSKGVFAVAICGTEEFDVMTIDPTTVKIYIEGIEEGVAPIRWGYADVATPYIGEEGGGHALLGDGYMDLVFLFDTQMVAMTLGLAGYVGEIIPLMIKGNLFEEFDGTAIKGEDYVWIIIARR